MVVADLFQGRGLGTLLLGRLLAYARAQNISTWLAEINAQNARMLGFIQRGGGVFDLGARQAIDDAGVA